MADSREDAEHRRPFLHRWQYVIALLGVETSDSTTSGRDSATTSDLVTSTVSYPSLGCSGDLELRAVESDHIKILETLDHDPESNCISSGIIRLEYESPTEITYRYESDTSGTLNKLG